MKLKNIIITAIILTTSFILVSCSEKPSQVKPTLNVDLGADVATLDPQMDGRHTKRQSGLRFI